MFRICPGLTLDEFETLSKHHDLTGWLTLPVSGDAFPHLFHMQRTLQALHYESGHDPMTGLANRRTFERNLDMEIERAKRNLTPMSLAMIDLDDFKAINDTHGHLKGDEVLVRIGETLASLKRRYDIAARIGGEEFAVILAGVGMVKAEEILSRLLESIRELEFDTPDHGSVFRVTTSIGLTSYRGRVDMTPARLMDLADKALYEAKESGKNKIVVSALPDLDAAPRETLVHANEKSFLFTGK